MFFRRRDVFIIIDKTDQEKPFTMPLTAVFTRELKTEEGLKQGTDLG